MVARRVSRTNPTTIGSLAGVATIANRERMRKRIDDERRQQAVGARRLAVQSKVTTVAKALHAAHFAPWPPRAHWIKPAGRLLPKKMAVSNYWLKRNANAIRDELIRLAT